MQLEIARVLPAAPSIVFEFFSDASRLARWWGPKGFSIPDLDWKPRAGAAYRIDMQPPDGDAFALVGEFREVDVPSRLAFTFLWEDPDPDDVETVAVLSFADLGQVTEVVLTQGPFRTEARRELHRGGWTDSFDKLEEMLAAG